MITLNSTYYFVKTLVIMITLINHFEIRFQAQSSFENQQRALSELLNYLVDS